MKVEVIKFIDENFEVIKNNFLKAESDILEELLEDDGNKVEFDMLSNFLNESIDNATSAEELLDVINERSLGVDLDGDEINDLFNMIKTIPSWNS